MSACSPRRSTVPFTLAPADFDGQPIAEKDQTGNWTDYIYANGGKIARVAQTDPVLHTSGTFTQNWNEIDWPLTVPTDSSGRAYTVKSGDKLCFRQYTHSAVGGMGFFFSDGQWTGWQWTDTNGASLNQFSSEGAWANRCTDVTWNGSTVGSTITGMQILTDVMTGPGNWDIWYADMSFISTDGTVTPVNLASAVGPWGSSAGPNYVASSLGAAMDTGPAGAGQTSTHFYLGDHLGTAQMEFSSGGWPVWQGQFAPFGQELNTQSTANNYKLPAWSGIPHQISITLSIGNWRSCRAAGCPPTHTMAAWISGIRRASIATPMS